MNKKKTNMEGKKLKKCSANSGKHSDVPSVSRILYTKYNDRAAEIILDML